MRLTDTQVVALRDIAARGKTPEQERTVLALRERRLIVVIGPHNIRLTGAGRQALLDTAHRY